MAKILIVEDDKRTNMAITATIPAMIHVIGLANQAKFNPVCATVAPSVTAVPGHQSSL